MKRKLVLLQVFIAIVMVCTSVYATLDTTVGVTVSSSTVYKGDEIEVTLALKDVNSSKKIINVEGYLNYDEDIFEEITVDSIVKNNDNKVKIGDETLPVEDANEGLSGGSAVVFTKKPSGEGSGNDVKILIDSSKGISNNTDLLTIKFKVKSDARTGNLENAIECTKFVAKSEDDSSNEITEKINITVKTKTETPKEDQKNESKNENKKAEDNKNDAVGAVNDKNKNTNTNTNSNKNTNNTNANTNNTNTDDSVSGKKLPAAGAKVLVVPAIILIAVAYITYNRYIRLRGI